MRDQGIPDQPKQDNGDNVNNVSASSLNVRGRVGQATVQFSALMNEHLAAARSVVLATIGILTVYGLSQTPLFFRYSTVAEIPARYFSRRRYLRGRLMSLQKSSSIHHHHHHRHSQAATITNMEPNNEPIRVYIRHLSPMEQLLPRNIFEAFLQWHPASAIGVQPGQNRRELLHVEIAGIQTADDYVSTTVEPPGAWLDRLVRNHTTVTLQLLGRRPVPLSSKPASSSLLQENSSSSSSRTITTPTNIATTRTRKREIPGLEHQQSKDDNNTTNNDETATTEQIAVARLYYRPQPFQLFATDIGYDMVRYGRANVSGDGLYGSSSSTNNNNARLVDTITTTTTTTTSVKELQANAAYMERLAAAEYQAAAESRGQWADATVRQRRRDVVEEVDFQTNATVWQKLWRRLRGG